MSGRKLEQSRYCVALTPPVKQEVQAAADREETSTAVPALFQDKLLLFKMFEGTVDQRGPCSSTLRKYTYCSVLRQFYQ